MDICSVHIILQGLQGCCSSHRFYCFACYCLGIGGIDSAVCSIVLSKDIKPFVLGIMRADTRPQGCFVDILCSFVLDRI